MSKERLPTERIQKALARQGVASRRQIENLIEEGKLLLNGKQAVIGDQVSPGDVVMCLGAGDITAWAAALPHQLDKLAGESA